MFNLLELPNEILLQIMGHLRVEDIKSTRLTCKRLYFLSLDKTIIKNEYLLLNERIFKESGYSVVSSLLISKRIFDRIVIKNDNNYFEANIQEDLLANVIRKFGEHVKELFFIKTNLEFCKVFTTVIEFCSNLELLCLKDCNDTFWQRFFLSDIKLQKMKTLKIIETKYLTDFILHKLFNLFPNLEQISISSCGMNFHNGIYGKYYKTDPNDMLRPSDDVFNFKYVFYLLHKLVSITELNLSLSAITHENLKQVFNLPNLKLRKLNLLGCREISWKQFLRDDIFCKQTGITYLNLSHSTSVNDDALQYICNNLPNIQILYLSNCFALTDEGFVYIHHLKKLQQLNINNNHKITGDVCCNLLKCNLHSLMALHTLITSDQIINSLTKFNLIKCEIGNVNRQTKFSDKAIQEINKKEINLKELHIHSLTITDDAFIGQNNNEFETDWDYTLSFLNKIAFDPVSFNLQEDINVLKKCFPLNANTSEDSISNLKKLEILNLDYCIKVTDLIFKCSMDLSNLRTLNLSSTNINITGICYLVQKCPNIETLGLESTKMTDSAISIICQGFRNLSHLNLKYCKQLTQLSFEIIANHCTKLRSLHVWSYLIFEQIVHEHYTKIYNLPKMCKLYGTNSIIYQDMNVSLSPYLNNAFYEEKYDLL